MSFNAVATATAYATATATAIANAKPTIRGALMHIGLTVHLHSYVGNPYRPEMEKLINITKESGMNRARSTANRRKALEEHLRSEGMTLAEFDALEKLAHEPWDVDPEGHITIPRLNVTSMCVAMCDSIRSAQRPVAPDMVRIALRPMGWSTNVGPEDAQTWTRFAVVNAGTGAKLSNQRGMRVNQVVGDLPPEGEATKRVIAKGSFDVNPEMVRPEVLANALSWAGEYVGIGASRKMGWGRFTIESFDVEG